MTALELTLWMPLMFLGFMGSALFSGLETGAYSLNRVRLQIYHHQHNRAAHILRKNLDRPTQLLTTLLIGNNITNYIGTASLAVILESRGLSDWSTILLNTLIVTPILFVFGETLPKDLFAAFSDRLMYRLADVLEWSRRLFTWTGLVPLIGAFSHGVMVALGQGDKIQPFHPRRQVQALVKEGVGYGLLSDDQSAMVERVLGLGNVHVGDEMVQWDQVITIASDAPPEKIWELADRTSHSRFPVVNAEGDTVGVINVMRALPYGKENCPPIQKLMRPVTTLAQTLPIRRGLSELQHKRAAIAVVVDERSKPVGIVTVKDLVETITGELASW